MSETTDILHVVHNEGEDKPWEIKFDDVGGLKRARAILNYPVHKFESEEKAVEVAEMLRDIIHAKGVAVENEHGIRDDTEKAEFFHPVQADDEPEEDTVGVHDEYLEEEPVVEEWHNNVPVTVTEKSPELQDRDTSNQPSFIRPPEPISRDATVPPERF